MIICLQLYVIYKIGHRVNKKLFKDLIKIVIGSGILGVVLYLLDLNMWIALPVGIIIYLVCMIVLKLFDDDDKFIIKEIMGKINWY